MNYLTAVYETFVECGITTFPVDCFSILQHYGFRVRTYAQLGETNQELYGLCLSVSNDAFTDKVNNIVAYNEKNSIQRIRFSLMHELAHHILKHKGQSQENEDEADYFASNILAPRAIMGNLNCRNADDVHATFEISYAASNRAWYDYRNKTWSNFDQRIKEHFFPSKQGPEKHETSAFEIIENIKSKPKESFKPSAKARNQRTLNRIRLERKKIQKRLIEYQDDMKFLDFNENKLFDRLENHWLFKTDL